jgi:molecular chaperone Hsp33
MSHIYEGRMTHDDAVLPFQVEGRDVRGRVVRLNRVANEILNTHDYPEGISSLLAHALTLVSLLGDALKFDGKLTLQAKGEGPVTSIVADYRTPGELRGWVGYDEDAYRAAVSVGVDPAREVQQLLGSGYLALTIDQGPDTERYQGIVSLEGGTLAECAQTYFDDSEQIPTAVKLAASKGSEGWRAGGIMIQHLPHEAGREVADDGDLEENWRECAVLMASTENSELVASDLPAEQLLFRLFHESGVRVFDQVPLDHFCQCSKEKVENVLRQFSPEELEEMKRDGKIVVTCQFCSREYRLDPPRDRSH